MRGVDCSQLLQSNANIKEGVALIAANSHTLVPTPGQLKADCSHCHTRSRIVQGKPSSRSGHGKTTLKHGKTGYSVMPCFLFSFT